MIMDNKVMLKGMINGIESMGGKFIKVDYFDFFFEIKKGSEIDNKEKLKIAKSSLFKTFGLGLKIKRI